MEEKKIQELTNTIPDFEELKIESEKFWQNKELEDNVYVFQIQTGSKWKNTTLYSFDTLLYRRKGLVI